MVVVGGVDFFLKGSISVRGIQGDSRPFSGSLGDPPEALSICFHLLLHVSFIVLLHSWEAYWGLFCLLVWGFFVWIFFPSQKFGLICPPIYCCQPSMWLWGRSRSIYGCHMLLSTVMKGVQGECFSRAALAERRLRKGLLELTSTMFINSFLPFLCTSLCSSLKLLWYFVVHTAEGKRTLMLLSSCKFLLRQSSVGAF